MTNSLQKASLLLMAVAVMFAAVFAINKAVYAQDNEAQESEATPISAEVETTSEDSASNEQSDSYSFVAQPGDSYTKMARKATQIYGIENGVNLSGAQIVFVETNATQLAGSPLLEVDEQVSITKSTIAEWVEKSKNLSDEQLAAWQVYADSADFNTDDVGESR